MDEDIITEADLAEARERWADPSHKSAVDDIFESPVYGKGFRGDNPVIRSEKNAEADRQRKGGA